MNITLKDKIYKAPLTIALLLNITFFVLECSIAIIFQTFSLLSDAIHNLGDTLSILMVFIGWKLSSSKPTKKFNYGFKRVSILISFTNALILTIVMGVILFESVKHTGHSHHINGHAISITAGIGIIIKLSTAAILWKIKKKDLSSKAVWLHVMSDVFLSIGVAISGIIIAITGISDIDKIVCMIIAVIIICYSLKLLFKSFILLIDGVPDDIDVNDLIIEIKSIDNVEEVTNVKVRAISTFENQLTAKIKLNNTNKQEETINRVKHLLQEKGINNTILEADYC